MNEKMPSKKISRRTFLKSTAAMAAVAATGDKLFGGPLSTLMESVEAREGEQTISTGVVTCPGNGCHQNCGLRAYVKDGKVTQIDPAPFPDPAMTHACVKGLSAHRWLYSPDRLQYPMKRVGERGEGKWQRITWEEALDTIATKIQSATNQYGPESIVVSPSSSSYYNRLGGEIGSRMANLLQGLSRWGWFTSGDNAPCAATGLLFGYTYFMGDSVRDAVNYKTYVLWGCNLAETAPRNAKYLLAARSSGTKIVYIGPVYNKTAALADWFIPVKHGMDSVLALAVMNILIANNTFDAGHVKAETCGPLLVRSDNGHYLRENDVRAGGSSDNFVVWDAKANAQLTLAPGVNLPTGADPALLGTYTVNGIECKPAFQLLAERAAEYPLDKAAQLSGVPTATIQQFASDLGTTKSTYHYVGIGPGRQYYGTLETRAIYTLAIIAGQMGATRASASSAKLKPINQANDKKTKPVFSGDLTQGIKNGTLPVKVFINVGSNVFWSQPNARLSWIEGVLPKLDFFVTDDVFMSWTAQYSDIVLPDTTIFETYNLAAPDDHLLLTQPLVQPMYECKPAVDFWQELAQRLGLGEYFGKTPQDWIKEQLSSGDASIEGITFERLQSEGIVRLNAPPSPRHYVRPATTASKRIEFYNENLLPIGEELPVHKDSPEQITFGGKYPLNLITTRIMFFMQSIFANVDFLREIAPEPYLEINPIDANARDIKTDDVVRVYNDRGAFKVKARITEAVPPGTLNVPYHFRPEDFIEGHPSLVIAPAEENINPIQKLYPTPENNGSATGCLWDCLVEMERA